MSTPTRPRRHRRAVRQLLLGLVPVLVVGLVAVCVLAARLPGARAPLAAATASAPATVSADGGPPDGRGLTVTFRDAEGRDRTGKLVLRRPADVPSGAALTVRYDPDEDPAEDPADDHGPVVVHADGDAASGSVADLVFGLVALLVVLAGVTALTAGRLLGRPRLRRRPAGSVRATHVVSRQGLVVRSWLELATPAGLRWLPVHWAPELERLAPDSGITVHGNTGRDRLVLPVVGGTEVWPAGRLRDRAPRGDLRQVGVDPAAPDIGMARQARADGVLPFLAPVLGLLWAYVGEGGTGSFLVATALAAAVLFWLPQLLGSDPRST
ncbi:hypothetical protein [Modestobacter lapidis]|nr:hypothetical protein [Modestobacter lapidis]